MSLKNEENVFSAALEDIIMAADFIEIGVRHFGTVESVEYPKDGSIVLQLPANSRLPAVSYTFADQEVTLNEKGAFQAIDTAGVAHELIAKGGHAIELHWYRGFSEFAAYKVVSGYPEIEPKILERTPDLTDDDEDDGEESRQP